MHGEALHERAQDFIGRETASGLLPPGAGIAVSLTQGKRKAFHGTYGLRKRDPGLRVSPRTIFEISSLTKAFTSTAFLIACESGKLDLDRPINHSKKLLPLSDAEASKKVSIADILYHRSGVPANDLLWYFGPKRPTELLRAVGHLELAPGDFKKGFNYNNLMYGVLGNLFEEILGESWEAYVARKILTPLKMTDTSFGTLPHQKNVALPYVGTRRVEKVDMASIQAAGAITSTLTDMTRWLSFHAGDGRAPSGVRLLSEFSMERMRKAEIHAENVNPAIFQGLEWLNPPRGPHYGLGWFIGAWNGMKTLYHPGLIDGFSTTIVIVPEKKLSAIVMTNLNLSAAPGLLIRDLFEATLENRESTRADSGAMSRARDFSAYTGTYIHPAYGTLALVAENGKAALLYNDARWPLEWETEGSAHFSVTIFGIQLPLTVQFTSDGKQVRQISIPLSLDPRVEPQVFTRRSA